MARAAAGRGVPDVSKVVNSEQGGERILALMPKAVADRVRKMSQHIQTAPSGVVRVHRALKAVPELDKMVAANPKCKALLIYRGFIKRVGNLYAEGVEDLTKGIEAHPGEPQAYFWRATGLGAIGRFKEAVADITKAISLAPDCAEYYKLRGQAREKAGQLEEAKKDFAETLRCDPKFDWAYIGRSMVGVKEGRLEDALRDLDEAIKIQEKEEWAFLKRSIIRRQLGDVRGAVEDATRACEINPVCDWVDAKMPMHEDKLLEALAPLDRFLKEEPGHDWARAWRGQTLLKLERFAEAEAELSTALKGKLGKGKGWVFAWRGEARRKQGNLEGAESDFASAIKLRPDYPRVYFWRAAMRMDQDRAKDALKDLTACAKLYDRSPEVQALLGQANEKLGKLKEALACYSLGLRMDPSGGDILQGRARVRAALGDAAGQEEDLAAYYGKISISPQGWKQAFAQISKDAGPAAERVWRRLKLPLEVRLAQAGELLSAGDARAALGALDHARAQGGAGSADLHQMRGLALRKLNALEEAKTAFQTALKLKQGGSAAPVAAEEAAPETRMVWIDPRLELLGAVQRLLEPKRQPNWAKGKVKGLVKYACDAQNHFGAFSDLPEVALLGARRQEPKAYRWFPLAKLLLAAGPVPELAPRAPIQREHGDEETLAALRGFAEKSRFMDFLREHEKDFPAWAKPGQEALKGEDFRASIAGYLGAALRADFGVILTVLGRDLAYSDEVVRGDGWTESRTIVCALDDAGDLWRGLDPLAKETLLAKGWHELCHTAMDPWIEGYAETARAHERLYAKISGTARRTGWLDCLSEHMVLSPSVRLAGRVLGPQAARAVAGQYKKSGYAYIEAFAKKLEDFEARRERYPSLAEFYPEWIQILKDL